MDGTHALKINMKSGNTSRRQLDLMIDLPMCIIA
jgi:hypothetical protein